MARGLPDALMVTVAVEVAEPEALVAVRVQVVVAVGVTAVEPLAEVEVKVPGVMAMLVAPVVTQLSVLLAPALMLVGSAVKDVMVGMGGGALTVTMAVAVVEPEALVAVSVQVVVAVGVTVREPLAAVEVKVPGVMAMVVAPVVAQLSVLPAPELMLVGLAAKDVMVGLGEAGGRFDDAMVLPQPARPAQVSRRRAAAKKLRAAEWPCDRKGYQANGGGKSIWPPFVALFQPV